MSSLKVGDKYRTNGLSLIPGGKKVSVTYEDGTCLIYDKIKSPKKYIKSISAEASKHGAIVKVSVGGEDLWDTSKGTDPWELPF
jgi:hypothetical protein